MMSADRKKYNSISDSDLVSLLQASNHNAYTELYWRYSRLMIAFAYKKLQDKDLTEDFVQDLFISLWERREYLQVNTSFSAYLYTCLRNKIVDHFLHQKVETKYHSFLKEYISTRQISTSDHLIREKQLKEYIDAQIDQLPKKMRAIFELSRNEGMTHQEIADSLNISKENVSRQVSNALKILRTKLGALFFI